MSNIPGIMSYLDLPLLACKAANKDSTNNQIHDALMAMKSVILPSRSTEDTQHIASTIATELRPGDVVLLKGDLGAGKTHFVSSLAKAMGATNSITSPTFTIAHFYKTPAFPLVHIDAYRLSGPTEYRDLGLEEYTATSITLVEWGEIVEGEFSSPLSIAFSFVADQPTGRLLTISSLDERWTPLLTRLSDTMKVPLI